MVKKGHFGSNIYLFFWYTNDIKNFLRTIDPTSLVSPCASSFGLLLEKFLNALNFQVGHNMLSHWL